MTADQPPLVYVLIEQTSGEDGFLLGVFPTMAEAAVGSDKVAAVLGVERNFRRMLDTLCEV